MKDLRIHKYKLCVASREQPYICMFLLIYNHLFILSFITISHLCNVLIYFLNNLPFI